MTEGIEAGGTAKQPGRLRDYIAIARFDHATKHIFIVPGILLAYLLRGIRVENVAVSIACGVVAAVCIASANYVINEWLDRDFDRFHPEKSARASVQRHLSGGIVVAEWALFVAAGLAVAAVDGRTMVVIAILFALQGIVYNVRPLRTKEKPYLDVISEAVNNPFRLLIGWAAIDAATLPPSSVILAYWTGGAFLMTAKRLSEYREIVQSHGRARLAQYRASFAGYSETSLTVSCFVYALFAVFFLAVFLVKYRIEYLLLVPVVIALFAQYMVMAMQPGSTAQKPERLFRERGLMLLVALLAAAFVLTTLVDIPALDALSGQRFITIE